MTDNCVECGGAVRGGFEVSERQLADGTLEIVIDPTPDRDFNVCDVCTTVTHFRCSIDPASGVCNRCAYRRGEPVERNEE